jgi:transposase
VDKYSPYAKRFEDYVSEHALLCAKMTFTNTATVVAIDGKAAKRIDKKYLSRLVTGLDDLNPTRLGIDEVAYEKGHRYLTVVRDLDIGRVIWVGQRRKKETLDVFFTELGAEKCARIEVCVLDMWDPYIASIHDHTHAAIVYDLFHVAQRITDAVVKTITAYLYGIVNNFTYRLTDQCRE